MTIDPGCALGDMVSDPDGPARRAAQWWPWVERTLLAMAAVFVALHWVHLRADFPNFSPWQDWAKYTDEGWYGDAAIRHYQLGHWYVAGDFNPAAALPVWPAMEWALFRFTGVSVAAARALAVAVFALTVAGCYWLLRRWPDATDGPRAAPSLAAVLLAVSPFCFAFSRLAILEPTLVLLMVAAMLTASAAGRASAESGRFTLRSGVWCAGLGLLLPLMVLTKTTALFLFPAVLWMVWGAAGYSVRAFLRAAAPAAAMGAAVWGGYYTLLARTKYLVDYRYLFAANAYTGFTWKSLWPVLQDTVGDGMWVGKVLYPLALASVVAFLAGLSVRRWRPNPLPVALLLWIGGYGAFLAYHANLQPRYYMVLAFPLTMLVGIFFERLLEMARAKWPVRSHPYKGMATGTLLTRIGAAAIGAMLLIGVASDARQTISYLRHPEYSLVGAADGLHAAVLREVAAHPERSRLVLSISGSDISLMTGLPSICDDFGTMTLPDRIAAYKPGWFATWNEVEDDKMDALAPRYRLVRVGAYPAMDDPERNLLVLYRLDAVSAAVAPPPVRGRRRTMSVPPALRTRVGEQPSPSQLKH